MCSEPTPPRTQDIQQMAAPLAAASIMSPAGFASWIRKYSQGLVMYHAVPCTSLSLVWLVLSKSRWESSFKSHLLPSCIDLPLRSNWNGPHQYSLLALGPGSIFRCPHQKTRVEQFSEVSEAGGRILQDATLIGGVLFFHSDS